MRTTWLETKLADGASAWKCTACGLVIGGAPVQEQPGRCAVCSARRGEAVAVVAEPSDASLSMLVLDRELLKLLAAYRSAKGEYERELNTQRSADEAGHYGMDGSGASSDVEASASREQRSALALADATARRVRASRPSIPSLAPNEPRASRH